MEHILLGTHFSAENMQEIQNAFLDVQNALVSKGYGDPELSTESVTWEYLPNKIKTLFNNTELNTQKVDGVIDWINPYSKIFEWKTEQGYIYPFIKRWYDWLNYNNKVIGNEIQKKQYLFDKNGENIYNINGEKILTLEGYFS